MKHFILLLLLLSSYLSAQTRDEALMLAHEAGEKHESDPAAASLLAERAFLTLKKTEKPAKEDLAACAALTARTARHSGDHQRAIEWFETALFFAKGAESLVLRAENADLLMREGAIGAARSTLGNAPRLPLPSLEAAQWHQTSAKILLALGRPGRADLAIKSALKAVPKDEAANHAALLVDAAGIALRLDQPIAELVKTARQKILELPEPHPELLSALVSIAAQDPALTPEHSLSLLQDGDLVSRLRGGARLSYLVGIAEAAARVGKTELVTTSLKDVLTPEALPPDHPLLARALALAADASNNAELARRSVEVAQRWLQGSELTNSDLLLGLQRTVDPISPLVKHDLKSLPKVALETQNYALSQRLFANPIQLNNQLVLYLIYQRNFAQHYGALIFNPDPTWVDLGPAEKIHKRIQNTLDTAERTLAEEPKGVTMSVRLTQLSKSVWEPVVKHLDLKKTISIVPIGMLHAVPWSTLRSRKGSYLCQQAKEVRILALAGRVNHPAGSGTRLICGISEKPGKLASTGHQFIEAKLSQVVESSPALPGVVRELQMIGGDSVLNLSAFDFLQLLEKEPETIHFAGHGFVLEGEAGSDFQAGLIFGGGGLESILPTHAIASLQLQKTKLVVLSACRGGIGRGEVGGNWSSLRRAFIAAGVKHVLAAQWRVRDDTLPEFMKAFHDRLETTAPALALWQVQREWLENENLGDEAMRAASAGAWLLESAGE